MRPAYILGETSYWPSCLRNKSGVYVIWGPGGEVEYVGASRSCVYRACYRHFHAWTDVPYRVTFPKQGYKVAFRLTPKDKVFEIERELLLRYMPKRNTQLLPGVNLHEREDFGEEMGNAPF